MATDTTTAIDERPKRKPPRSLSERIAELPESIIDCVRCPVCRGGLVRAPNYWTCPESGHTKLTHDTTIFDALYTALRVLAGQQKRMPNEWPRAAPKGSRPWTPKGCLYLFRRGSRRGLIPSGPEPKPKRQRKT